MIQTISEECSIFLERSNGTPLLKNLRSDINGFERVKVRKRKSTNELDTAFNSAFEYPDLKQRCVISYSETLLPHPEENQEPFYIFPIDGFKVIFSEAVQNSQLVHSDTLDTLRKEIGVKRSGLFMSDLIKYTYRTQDLSLALNHDCEIILYNIAYYYALRKSLVDDYNAFIYE